MQSFSKYNNEIFPIETDFTNQLTTAEVIVNSSSSVDVIQNNADATDSTSSMITSQQIDSTSKKLQAKIQAGTANTTYFVKFIAVTDAGNNYQNTVRLKVMQEKGG